jgi:hypothetical protein
MKRLFCRHKLEATKWNNGSYSGACYPREYTCKKCNLKIYTSYKDRNHPVDYWRIILVAGIIFCVLGCIMLKSQ